MIRFGFRTAGFVGWTAEQVAAELARVGYDCIELCLEVEDVRPERLDAGRCAKLRETFERLGIGLGSVSYHGDREPREERRENQVRAVQIAKWLGTGIVIINAEKTVERERQWAEHVEQLRRLCERGEAAGVTLAMEPEPLLVVGSSEEMGQMLQEVGSTRLKVNLDVGHACVTDDDLGATIRQLGQEIVHVHLEDIQGRVHRHLPFGEGEIDFGVVGQALGEVGYSGPYVADLFNLGEDPSGAAARALGDMRRIF